MNTSNRSISYYWTNAYSASSYCTVVHLSSSFVGPEFVFDTSISHESIEISEDAKSMKAKPLKRSHVGSSNPTESGRLLNYRGTMANVPLYKPGLFYFELAVQYRVTRLIRQGSLFEVALARLGVVDKHQAVDCFPYAWAVSARGCHVCGKV